MEENTMKIQASDLRIGNFLDRSGLMEVVGIKIHAIKIYDHYNKIANPTWFQPEGFKGIPLTPEWLFKNTVVACDGKDTEWWELSGNGWLKVKPLEGSYFFFVGKQEITEVTTVHHLQNLFYAVTGQELTLKP